MARKKQVIRTESYVYVGGEPVRFDDLPDDLKRKAATELKLRWMRGLYPGVDFFVVKKEETSGAQE